VAATDRDALCRNSDQKYNLSYAWFSKLKALDRQTTQTFTHFTASAIPVKELSVGIIIIVIIIIIIIISSSSSSLNSSFHQSHLIITLPGIRKLSLLTYSLIHNVLLLPMVRNP
jgi:hypothetical protein